MVGMRVRQKNASRTAFQCVLGASKATGKGDIKESSASRTLNANSGDEQAQVRQGFQRAALFSHRVSVAEKRVAWFSLLSGQRGSFRRCS